MFDRSWFDRRTVSVPRPRGSFVALGALIFFLILTHSLAAFLAHGSPRWALRLNPNEAEALFRLAHDDIDPAKTRRRSEKVGSGESQADSADDQPSDLDQADSSDSDEEDKPVVKEAKKSDSDAAKKPDPKGETKAGSEGPKKPGSNEPEKSTPSPERLEELRKLAERAIMADPLRARNYRVLGQIAELQGNKQLASAAMLAAVRRSLHEGNAAFWLLSKGLDNKNYPAAAYYADVLLRSISVPPKSVFPALVMMLESKGPAEQEVLKLLTPNPPWRPVFFHGIYNHLSEATVPLNVFMSLRDTKAPATPKELNAYQTFLANHGLYELAYYVWLQFLSPQELENAGFIYNGGFESAPSGSPFDWQLPKPTNVTVEIAPKSDNSPDRALLIEFGAGRAEFAGVYQLTMLTPGRYKLKGSYKSDLEGPRGVTWSIACVNRQRLGQSERIVGQSEDWSGFEFSFSVPEKDCPVQAVGLSLAARSPSEEMLAGEAWFDNLAIVPN